jgi:lambda family phage minor tail protein L
MPSVASTAQQAGANSIVDLFTLDATALTGPAGNGQILRWVSGNIGESSISYQGYSYTPLPVMADGFEWNGRGPLPTPRIRVSNVLGSMTSLNKDYGDMVGATLMRLRTFYKHLDTQTEADPDAHWPPEIYRVERKVSQNKIMVEWELSASIDQEGKMLPGRQCIRDTCMWIYRSHISGTTFNYTNATCPYAGTSYYKADGTIAGSASEDVCGHRLSDCKLRYGSAGSLPFGGYPGMLKFRF